MEYKLQHKSYLLLAISCSVLMIIDSTIVSIYLTIDDTPSYQANIFIFVSFLIVFILSNYTFLQYIKGEFFYQMQKITKKLNLSKKLIILNQSIISIALTFIIVQIVLFGNFNIVLISFVIYTSHILSIILLILLTYLFYNWYFGSKSYVVLTYALAFAMISFSLVISLIYINIEISIYDPIVKHRSINASISEYLQYEESLYILGTIYTYFSIIAFVSIWIASVILLRTYSVRFGKLLYWMLVTIPMVFFLFPFISDNMNMLDSLFIEYGDKFTLLYYILFSPYKQIGGLLFGIVFWLIGTKITRPRLKTLVNTAGFGIILLFSSVVLHGLSYIVSPPFGLITISFTGLASYMLFIGIFISARELTIDSEIRKELYKMVEEQISLLRNISMADLIRNSEKMVNTAKNKIITDKQDLPKYYDDSDYKEFLQEVVKELTSIKEEKK